MSNRSRKAEQRAALAALADEQHRAQVLATPRPLDSDIDYAGAGELLFRLACQRAFEPPVVWEVRSFRGKLTAYKARGADPDSALVVGHEAIDIDDGALRAALDELSLVAVPLTPGLTNVAVADGGTFFATIRVGFSTSLRLSWPDEDPPAGWSSAVQALLRVRDLLERPGGTSSRPLTPMLVGCRGSTAQLVRLSSGEFHMWVAGTLGSLVCGPDYILARDVLADALKKACGDDIDVVAAAISSRATGESWAQYREIRPLAELGGPDDLPAARLSGRAAWHFGRGNLFVSPQVKEALGALQLPDLEFSIGFGQFGGRRGY